MPDVYIPDLSKVRSRDVDDDIDPRANWKRNEDHDAVVQHPPEIYVSDYSDVRRRGIDVDWDDEAVSPKTSLSREVERSISDNMNLGVTICDEGRYDEECFSGGQETNRGAEEWIGLEWLTGDDDDLYWRNRKLEP